MPATPWMPVNRLFFLAPRRRGTARGHAAAMLRVGLPIDLPLYRRDALTIGLQRRLTEEDPYFKMIRERWSEALRDATHAMPRPSCSPFQPSPKP
jgi:predicted proteasome-type protease